MNIEEAIKTAIEYEKRVRDVYVEALDDNPDPVGERIFKLLADEEHGHVIFLEATLARWVAYQKLSLDDLETAVPPAEEIARAAEKLEDKLLTGNHGRELEILKKARDVESETSSFYQRMVAELPPDARDFFNRFVVIEQGHLALVEAEIDFLEHKGAWLSIADGELKNR